ncbi:unnamed protein product [Leptidea sinapis]|uniref:Uncharacterized protein n=1 Tax=Leptidea sinapis TaxID=189913 RepID=A0A5E4QWI8_9NEOP|nr:unnamed protein product [Leptidea sinapis]
MPSMNDSDPHAVVGCTVQLFGNFEYKSVTSAAHGLEIVNPQAAETKVNEANAKYFSNTSGFLSVGKKTT